jgi:hypothetical protein
MNNQKVDARSMSKLKMIIQIQRFLNRNLELKLVQGHETLKLQSHGFGQH